MEHTVMLQHTTIGFPCTASLHSIAPKEIQVPELVNVVFPDLTLMIDVFKKTHNKCIFFINVI